MPAVDRKTRLFDPDAMESLRREHRLDPQAIRQLRNDLLKKFESDRSVLAKFPAADSVSLHVLELYQRMDSELDGATKLLFETRSGMLIESVILRIATGRTTLCVSSQVGCAAACDFCATGKMGIARNLETSEILDQIVQAGQMLQQEGRRLSNIVFMGMGEPLHNESNVTRAIELLTASDHFARSPSTLLVSTVGVPAGMLRLAKRFPKLNLALSLHSANQAVREKIIPLGKKASLEELHSTISQIQSIQDREFMIEYLMLDQLNDSADDVQQLIDWIGDLRVHINLIPYNTIDASPHLRATPKQRIESFASELKQAGFKTTVRYSLGSDIEAACGQLIRQENRQRAMADRAVQINIR
ncbi:23S rRNA (adenine(2503)-C(2))-methyltransferase RlmN [Rhodopirellula sp. JC740]|uniref:23S rRNA (Adenine(2503)-C(2))-methyltransferase RlmN n=1 Tax=Rhodopirellula halodulae TaxID=2894198 RepID=A0ABS8NCH4_9BACT|nr:23S rRNA (adenine(2503)-C(2))-methyltransferase RlmN [Rhodopirellula sp. JC740]MCC9641260.1 23S rRNA (adenine(2503)-C(2))-methyltransferase RlmN [Rhodopirellula sp. JC740]